MNNLGPKIKKIRKEKKITLSRLAGEDLSASMLSLIENDKATPSIEMLSLIANKLNIPINELFEEVNMTELRNLFKEVKFLYPRSLRQTEDQKEKLVFLVKPYIDRLPICYESGQLFLDYGDAIVDLKADLNFGLQYIDKAIYIFKEIGLVTDWIEANIYKSTLYFLKHDYNVALQILIQTEDELSNLLAIPYSSITATTHIDLLFMLSQNYFAVGNSDEGYSYLRKVLQYYKEINIFYRTNEVYRLAIMQATLDSNKNDLSYFFKKFIEYIRFSEDVNAKLDLYISMAHYHNNFSKNIDNAHHYLLKYLNTSTDNGSKVYEYFNLEMGINLYLKGEYKKALTYLDKIGETPVFIQHPYELARFAQVYTYRALCYEQFGQLSDAIVNAKIAVDKVKFFSDTPYKKFIKETYNIFVEKINEKKI